MSDHPFDDIEATLKKSVAAFREANVPALLAGSLAVWARGGPEARHDLDFVDDMHVGQRDKRVVDQPALRLQGSPPGPCFGPTCPGARLYLGRFSTSGKMT